jgi:hypothetical protein
LVFDISRELSLLAPTIVSDLIRVGRFGDGGYVVSEASLKNADCLISFGLCDDWTFEQDFLSYHPAAKIHVYDHTVSERAFYRIFRKNLLRFLIGHLNEFGELKRSWSIYKSYQSFFRDGVKHFRNRVHNKCDLIDDANIEMIMSRITSNKIFLKMDIEGGEYRVIKDILKYSDRITGLAIEFHDTEPLRDTFLKNIRDLQRYFTIVHVHPNNCGSVAADGLPECLEISFLRNDFIPSDSLKRGRLPVEGLDVPCSSLKNEYQMRFDLPEFTL